MKLMCISLYDVNSSDWTAKPKIGFAVKSKYGGAYRDRTGDLLNANQALSQLS